MDATDALIDRRSVQLPRHIPIPYQFLDASNTVSEPHCAQLIPANFTHDLDYMDDAYRTNRQPACLAAVDQRNSSPVAKGDCSTRERGSERQSIYVSADNFGNDSAKIRNSRI
jgi:hypothetical protein